MGLTVLELEVGNPARPKMTVKVEFLIDSGVIYSVVPTPILEKLGIRPITQEEFRLADGSRIVRNKGIALFRHGKKVGGADVTFGEKGDSNLLGALTLEALGLALDPLRRELKPLPMILAESRRQNAEGRRQGAVTHRWLSASCSPVPRRGTRSFAVGETNGQNRENRPDLKGGEALTGSANSVVGLP